ncbi:MAG: hypothetical protein ACE5G2_10715, partial [Candidatus Krumholzibacteriia bacterium]
MMAVTPVYASWSVDGIPIAFYASGQPEYHQITSDGSGGTIIAWQDSRGGEFDIYAQRVDASGTVLWTGGGVAICTATGDQTRPRITSDGSGGAIITWQDDRSGGNSDIYAQRVDASGTALWTARGVGICTAANGQYRPKII